MSPSSTLLEGNNNLILGFEVLFLKTTSCYMTRSCVNSSHITAWTRRSRDSSCPVGLHRAALRKPVGVDRQRSTEQTRSPATQPSHARIRWNHDPTRDSTGRGGAALHNRFRNAHTQHLPPHRDMTHHNGFTSITLFLWSWRAKIISDTEIRVIAQPKGWVMIQLIIAPLAICGLVYTGKWEGVRRRKKINK